MNIEQLGLSNQEVQEVKSLLLKSGQTSLTIEGLWQIIDSVWDELGCNNKNNNLEKLGLFYQHPVWLLNGLFVEHDDFSMQSRLGIAYWIGLNKDKINSVLDYGGGFGTLARLIAEQEKELSIDIYEPYPSNFAISKVAEYPNVNFVGVLNKKYDCLTCLDVLEHVFDPLDLFSKMIETVKLDGYLVIANHFHPVIKCHLPETFHFRYTFNYFAKIMGLKFIGSCEGSHALLYKKVSEQSLNWNKIRQLERFSKVLFPFLNTIYPVYKHIKRGFR